MAAKFFTGGISLQPKSFSEFAQQTVANMRKEASAQQGQIKTAGKLPDALKEHQFKGKNEKEEGKEDKKEDGKEDKEASSSTVTKEAKKGKQKDEGETSGQLKVEPLHQKGESDKGSKITDKNKKVEASGKNEDDKAGSSGQLDVEPLHQKGESDKPSAVNGKNKVDNDSGKSKGTSDKKEDSKEEKKEASTVQTIKLAKLDGKTRDFLKTYWSNLYPSEYVEFMLSEK
jgi:hypothetical protein